MVGRSQCGHMLLPDTFYKPVDMVLDAFQACRAQVSQNSKYLHHCNRLCKRSLLLTDGAIPGDQNHMEVSSPHCFGCMVWLW